MSLFRTMRSTGRTGRLLAATGIIALAMSALGAPANATPPASSATVSPANLLVATELPPMGATWGGPGISYPRYYHSLPCNSWEWRANFPDTVTDTILGSYGTGQFLVYADALVLSFDSVASATAERERRNTDFATCVERYRPVNQYEPYVRSVTHLDTIDGVPVYGVVGSYLGYETLGDRYHETFVVQSGNRLLYVTVFQDALSTTPRPPLDMAATVAAAKRRVAAS